MFTKMTLIQNKPLALFLLILSIAVVFAFMPQQADARKGNKRGKTHTSVNRNKNTNRNVNVNSNKNVNRNTNVNVNKNVNVDVDVNRRRGRGYHPIATGVAIGVTAAIIGSMVNTLPTGCTTVITNGISYSQCGNTWYQPQYSGNNVTYIVVNAP